MLTLGYLVSQADCLSSVSFASERSDDLSKSKKTRSPTFATRSSWLPGTMVEAGVVEAVSVGAGVFAQAASRARPATAPKVFMLLMYICPCLGTRKDRGACTEGMVIRSISACV